MPNNPRFWGERYLLDLLFHYLERKKHLTHEWFLLNSSVKKEANGFEIDQPSNFKTAILLPVFKETDFVTSAKQQK